MQTVVNNIANLHSIVCKDIADIIWVVDLDSNLVYVTPSIEKVLGYTVNEAMNSKMEAMFTQASIETIQKSVQDELFYIKNGQPELIKPRILDLELWSAPNNDTTC